MNKIKVHQFSPSASKGDGITNGMFYLQKILISLGFESIIYAQNIREGLENLVFHYDTIDKKDINQIIFIHYSIYYDFSVWIDKLNIKKHIIYHNITPPEFFIDNKHLYEMCKNGIELLPSLANKFEGSIGDSILNSSELKTHNFKNIYTIPFLVDINKVKNSLWNENLFDELCLSFNIIFVGRIAKNKAQLDLIKIANIYKHMSRDFKMYIIGGTTDFEYYKELVDLINKYNLQENVILTGKVSNEDLYAYYKSANIFLCMSEHEGFGMPLIESMIFNVPVLAYNSSNIANTLNNGGIILNEKSYENIAALIHTIRTTPKLRYELIQKQKEAIKIYEHENIVNQLIQYLKIFDINTHVSTSNTSKEEDLIIQIEGPFDSSYSLAILNKNAAISLNKIFENKVALYSKEGYGDFEANKEFLVKNDNINKMYKKSMKASQCELTLRNLYPPKVSGMKSDLNILNSYGWEESGFPIEYVDDFNENLDGIIAVSSYVKNVLISNAVKVPIKVIGNGVDHLLHKESKDINLKTKKTFKFLHISSCFPRKGIDLLLEAYCFCFKKEDDVVLIIKTFPNEHNTVEVDIKTIQNKHDNYPEIELINKDLDEEYISYLYKNTNCLVAPSRGEGFGLPMAEAMLFDLPVITTGYGGALDFCKNDNSWLIDYSFEKAKTHISLSNSYWAEPCLESLKFLLKEQVSLSKEEKALKTNKAKEYIKSYTWDNYAKKTISFLDEIKDENIFPKDKKLAFISSYNTMCGIATYSEFLLEYLSNEFDLKIYANYTEEIILKSNEINVKRCWKNRFDENNNELIENILKDGTTDLIINFNFSFFSMSNLETIIKECIKNNIKVNIIFHSVEDVKLKGLESSLSWIFSTLKNVNKLMVHNINDLNILKSFDLDKNAVFFPHGVKNRVFSQKKKIKNNFTIASFGFMLPHKGINELIKAFSIVLEKNPESQLLLVNARYPDPSSEEYLDLCKNTINELNLKNNITMVNDFLEDEKIFNYLENCDLLVMPYLKTQESCSGAIRYALSLMKPVLVSPINIFNDVSNIVHFAKDCTIEELAKSINLLKKDKNLLLSKDEKQKKWLNENNWTRVTRLLENIIR